MPQARTGLPYRDLPAQQHLTWWAADNLGNYYLGEQGSWDPRGGRGRAQWALASSDPRASSIDLMPTATTARAVIRLPLPRAGRAPSNSYPHSCRPAMDLVALAEPAGLQARPRMRTAPPASGRRLHP